VNALTQRHRAQQLLLRRATVAQLARLWPALDWTRLDATYPAFAVQVAALVGRNRETSAGLAAAYLRAFRRAQGLPDEVRIVFAQPLVVDQFGATLHSTTVAAAKASAARGVAADVAMSNALTLAQGAAARLVLDAGRATITKTLATEGVRWRRILGGGGCDFCRMLAGRGAVYAQDTVDFKTHGHCGCTAEPVY
jgi:hypothetical protein